MFDAAAKALAQMFTKPFRTVLLKSIGLAVALLALVAIVLWRLLEWLTGAGSAWVEGTLGTIAHGPLALLGWLLAIALGFGLIAGAIFLMPAVTALVASFFADEIAETVERTHYPLDPPGRALPLPRAVLEGVKTALLAILIYLCCAPFLLLAGFGAVLFFLATAYLLGREYFYLAAMRFHPVAEAKALRRAHRTTLFIAGMFIAAFVSIPIVNLATPLFGMAFMVHMHKRLSGPRPELIEPALRTNAPIR
jgi:CysZ protein